MKLLNFDLVIKIIFLSLIIALALLSFNLVMAENYLLAAYILFTSIIVIGMSIYFYRQDSKKKWLFLVINFLGFAQLDINLASGEFEIYHIALQVPWITFKRAGISSPWIISISIPIGVLIFIIFFIAKAVKNRDNTLKKEV